MMILCAGSAFAQGTFHYDWHGENGLFQASVNVPWDGVSEPGLQWGTNVTGVMAATAAFEDSFGNWFSATNCQVFAGGGLSQQNSLEWSVWMMSPTNAGFLVYEIYQESGPTASGITESGLWPGQSTTELGFWRQTILPTPEPGMGPLLVLGALVFWNRSHRVY